MSQSRVGTVLPSADYPGLAEPRRIGETPTMGLVAEKLYSLDEYAALEAASGVKHEYDHGIVMAMAGGTPEHSRIAMRIGSVLEDALKGKPCKPFNSDLKIKTAGRVLYPDVSVLSPPVKRDPELPDAVLNPRVVIEVLSDSTEAYDRGEKFALYRQNKELTDYILVSTARIYAEHYMRIDDDTWNLAFLGAESTLRLPGIDCEISLGSLYEGMEVLVA